MAAEKLDDQRLRTPLSTNLTDRGFQTSGADLLILAIDPGDVHCGLAWFDTDGVCRWAEEVEPWRCLATVRGLLENQLLPILVVEEFRLYPWQAENQAWSQMKTCELIGAIKSAWGWWGDNCELVTQPATIKKPTRAIARAKKVKSTAKAMGAGGHANDAEVHGWHYYHKQLNQGSN